MKVIADLHIHGRYSRATSKRMCIEEIARFARIKGLHLVGTGDFTHPRWLRELEENLVQFSGTGLYKFARKSPTNVCFIVATEVSTIFTFENEIKKIHHLILTPCLENAVQINERLARYGDLTVDGRPTLNMNAPHLVEEVMEVSSENMVFPAHAWTPWFSLFGAFSGFDSIEDCYQDMTKHIHALETGLSSDPPMNWRLSKLDKLTLISNSDCHSFWPWRIGREANVFDLDRLSYHDLVEAIRFPETERLIFTIETNPAYGKYHWTGHRNCNVRLSPQGALRFGNVCPVCRKKLTKGVEQRVEELADRPADLKPKKAAGFKHVLPLSELIMAVLGVDSPSTRKVWNIYNQFIERFGDEYTVLIDASKNELDGFGYEKIADAILRVRDGRVKIVPGFDGVYGQLVIFDGNPEEETFTQRVQQVNITDFM